MSDPEPAPIPDDVCELKNYGIHQDVVDSLFKSIVWWLQGEDLPWNQTRYVNVYEGPMRQMVVELLFFHYDGPPEREVGSGGENNYCKLYLYHDHMTVNFTGENVETYCGLTFKYTTRWVDTNKELLMFLAEFINSHLLKVFETEPHRFKGTDTEIQTIKGVVDIIEGVLSGNIIS